MTKFVLRNNYFKVNIKLSRKVLGTALDSRFALAYACIWMDTAGESVSLLAHFVFATAFIYSSVTKLIYLLEKTASFFLSHVVATVKSNLFFLFFLAYILITVCDSHLFVKFIPKHVNRHYRLIYEASLSNKNVNNFNRFLTISKCSPELSFELNFSVDSYTNSNFYVVDFYSLVQFTRSNEAALKSDSYLPKFFFIFFEWRPFGNDEKCFLFLSSAIYDKKYFFNIKCFNFNF